MEVDLEKIKQDSRIVFWLALFASFQITALLTVVFAGVYFGWFGQPSLSNRTPTQQPPIHVPNPQRISMSRDPSPTPNITGSWDQQVPENLNIVGITTEYKGLSPLKSGILNQSLPLLYDDPETDMIDAKYPESPKPPAIFKGMVHKKSISTGPTSPLGRTKSRRNSTNKCPPAPSENPFSMLSLE